MIFSPDLCDLILKGAKTETRRPVKTAVCRYVVGNTYAVQPGRGQSAIGRIRVTDVEKQELWKIDDDGAFCEGFDSVEDFCARWEALYGEVNADQEVWRIEFGLVPNQGESE